MSITILVTALTSGKMLRAQIDAIHKHIAYRHQILVVNDARSEPSFSNMWRRRTPQAIARVAKHAGTGYIRFPQALHELRANDANTRCADAIQYGLAQLDDDRPFLILDADMFPFRDFDPYDYLEERPIWGIQQHADLDDSIRYLWNGIMLVDPRRANRMDLFNIDCGQVNGCRVDVGGMLWEFVNENEEQIGYFERSVYLDYEMYADSFLHLHGGGNWELHRQEEAESRIDRFIMEAR